MAIIFVMWPSIMAAIASRITITMNIDKISLKSILCSLIVFFKFLFLITSISIFVSFRAIAMDNAPAVYSNMACGRIVEHANFKSKPKTYPIEIPLKTVTATEKTEKINPF